MGNETLKHGSRPPDNGENNVPFHSYYRETRSKVLENDCCFPGLTQSTAHSLYSSCRRLPDGAFSLQPLLPRLSKCMYIHNILCVVTCSERILFYGKVKGETPLQRRESLFPCPTDTTPESLNHATNVPFCFITND